MKGISQKLFFSLIVLGTLFLWTDLAEACNCIGNPGCPCLRGDTTVEEDEKDYYEQERQKPNLEVRYRQWQSEQEKKRRRKEENQKRILEREAEKRRLELEKQIERDRIRDNLKILEELLAKARSQKAEPHPKKTIRLDNVRIAQRRRTLESLLAKAVSTQPKVQNVINPEDSIEGEDLHKLLKSKRARRIRDAIVKGTPFKIIVRTSTTAQSYVRPWYSRKGQEGVTINEFWITNAAKVHRIDADFIRAIIWMETTHGWYDQYVPEKRRKTLLPMNVHVIYWKGLGITRKGMKKRDRNIMVGTRILKELWQRTDKPTIEKVATLYNSLRKDEVSDYGKTVAEYYRKKPWIAYLKSLQK